MKRTIFLFFILVIALTRNVALGDDDQRVPAGAVAFHFVARISFPEFMPPELVGYMAFIEGVPGPFFSETNAVGDMTPPGETTAFFTLRLTSAPPPIFLSPGSNVAVTLTPPGATFDVFFDETPNQDWTVPDSFSDGELIASFEESGFMSTSITEPGGSGVSYNLFSSDLIFSKRFSFNGERIDFKKLIRNGVTTNNFGSSTPVSFDPFTLAFTGSAVAIGGNKDD